MTVKPESNFGRQIIKNLPFAQWTRIENRHGGGIPDYTEYTAVKQFGLN